MSIRTLIAVLLLGAAGLFTGSSCGYDAPAYGPLADGGFTDGGMPSPMPPYAR